MKTIHKFVLENNDTQKIKVHIVKFLDVQIQDGVPCLWALVSTTEQPFTSYIHVYGTGHPIGVEVCHTHEYLATYQLPHIHFVGHVYVPKL